jgi:hypothetical protein
MPTPLSGIDPQGEQLASVNDVAALLTPADFWDRACKFDCSWASLTDCGRLARDIVLGVLCGTTMGLLVAIAGNSY